VNLKVKYIFDYKLVDRNGETYVQLDTGKVSFDASGGHFVLDNLFNGDPVLGKISNFICLYNFRPNESETS